MIQLKAYLKDYDWNIYIYLLTNQKDTNNIGNILNKYNIPTQILDKAIYRLTKFDNSGIIYNNNICKYSLIVVGETDSIQDIVNTLTHEKNHLEMYLCDYYNIDPKSEEAAILSGDISELLFRQLVKQLINYQV